MKILLGLAFIASMIYLLNAQCTTLHVVKSGESCNSIASRYNIPLSQLNLNNPRLNCSLDLKDNEMLCVDAAPECRNMHFVSSGETCNYIAANRGVDVEKLRRCNPSINFGCTNLAVGQRLLF